MSKFHLQEISVSKASNSLNIGNLKSLSNDLFQYSDAVTQITQALNKAKSENVLDFISEKLYKKLPKISQKKCIVVAVNGRSGVGKTQIVNKIAEFLKTNGINTTILPRDNYIIDYSSKVKKYGSYAKWILSGGTLENYDYVNFKLMRKHLKKLLENKTVEIPLRERNTGVVKNDAQKLYPSNLIIVDGAMVFNPKISDLTDIKIFIDADPEIVKDRWYKRAASRNKFGKFADQAYLNSVMSYKKNIVPQIKMSDIIIRSDSDEQKRNSFLNNFFIGLTKLISLKYKAA